MCIEGLKKFDRKRLMLHQPFLVHGVLKKMRLLGWGFTISKWNANAGNQKT
jgi:hypothetical protein